MTMDWEDWVAPNGPHFHACPECYEPWPCDDGRCDIEPDLSERGRLFGSHCVCEPCEARKTPQRGEDVLL